MNEEEQLEQLRVLIIDQVRVRIFEESIPRIKKCLDLISEEEVWQRPNEQSNSIGNLILHLCGNVRQWLISGLGGQEDHRNRQAEFSDKGSIDKVGLSAKLDLLQTDAEPVLQQVTSRMLTANYDVQCFQETGLSILVHIIEHFSYHTGQITFYVKSLKQLDTGYYSGQNLEKNKT